MQIFILIYRNLFKVPEQGFPRHEALVDPSGRADAATAERGGAHRGKDSQPGQECQPTPLDRRATALRSSAPPGGDRLTCCVLVDESAPSAAAARGLHNGRHWLMTAESRLPSMRDAVGSRSNGARQEAVNLNLVGGMQTLAPPKSQSSK